MVALMDKRVKPAKKGRLGELCHPAKLLSCHLIESDLLGNVLWSWSYPNCDNEVKRICLRRFNACRRISSKQEETFKFIHYRSTWFYTFISRSVSEYDSKTGKLEKVDQVGVVLEAEDFNPERYRTITEVLFQTYFKQENPTLVLQQFLSLVTNGTCQLPKKKIYNTSDQDAYFPYTNEQIKAIITKFGLEAIIIMTALIRKKRIAIYHHDVDELIKYVLNIPALGPDLITIWNYVYPWVGYNEDELSYFSNDQFCIVGCPNAGIENRSDLFDVFVNIPAGEVSVSALAKEGMMMGRPHKDMAMFLVQLAESFDSEPNKYNLVREIHNKMKESLIGSEIFHKMINTRGVFV